MSDVSDEVFVLEFGAIMAGAYCAQFLAEMGTDVVKVEPPAGGTDRTDGFRYGVDRSKRAIAVDLRTPRGHEIVLALVRQADVAVCNDWPGAMERAGLGYEELAAINPRLVYCALSGYGERGPMRDVAGQDLLIQAFAGLMELTGFDDHVAVPAGTFPSDAAAAVLSTLGVMFALYERERSGPGQQVKTSLLGSLLALMPWEVTDAATTPRQGLGPGVRGLPRRVGSAHYLTAVIYGGYWTKTGDIMLQGDVALIARTLGCDDLANDERYTAGRASLVALERDHDEVNARLQARWLR